MTTQITLQITQDERELLVDILTIRLGELREEIYHATVSDCKDQLKQKEVLMKSLIVKVQADDPGGSGH